MAPDALSWEVLLYTDRLCLRTPTLPDADALYDLFTDSEVMYGLGKEPVSAAEEARAVIEEWIGGWRTDGLGPFIIQTAATDRQVVGQAGLMISIHAAGRPRPGLTQEVMVSPSLGGP